VNGAAELVFIGGTGRSGTHALARLLGHHSRLADVPIEARFHCNKRGIGDLLEGRVTLAAHLAKLRGFWWHRVRVDGRPRGLYNLARRRDFDRACERLEADYPDDPIGACRRLFLDLLGPVAERAGKPGLVEMSSHNVKEAQTLLRLFPESIVLHALRDGRDSATSVAGKTWGPDGVPAAIDWWAERLRAIERGVRGEEDGASYGIAADRFTLLKGPADPPPPPAELLTDADFPGFRFGVRITDQAGGSREGTAEAACLPETLCVSGAVPGRTEVLVRIVGPKPNGYLWPTLAKLTTSRVEVWIEQVATGKLRYYRLEGASPGVDELPGLFDRTGFLPADGSTPSVTRP